MLSNVRPLNQAAQAPAYAGRHALLSTNKDLIICVVGTHTGTRRPVPSANCISYTSSSSSFQGGPPDRPNQAGQWSPLQPSFNSAGIGEHAATYMLITALVHSDL